MVDTSPPALLRADAYCSFSLVDQVAVVGYEVRAALKLKRSENGRMVGDSMAFAI